LARKKKREQKQREPQQSQQPQPQQQQQQQDEKKEIEPIGNDDNKAKALKKKIRQIEILIEKQKNGTKLNDDQITKISRLHELELELEKLAL